MKRYGRLSGEIYQPADHKGHHQVLYKYLVTPFLVE